MQELKLCNKCGIIKSRIDFHADRKKRDGLHTICKGCRKTTETTEEARKRRRIAQHRYYWATIEKQRDYDKNRDKAELKEQRHKQRQTYPETYRLIEQRKRSNLQYRLSMNISRRIRESLGKNKNRIPVEQILGYSISSLKKHLEKQFRHGMSWNNYGEWHIDHKIPINAFNFRSIYDLDFKKCWALANLQPLWAKDNIVKRDYLDRPFQPSLSFGPR